VKRAVAEGLVPAKSSAIAVVTGSGLKDVRSAQQAVGQPFEVAPDGSGLEQVLKKRELI
jgi:threonine synthase